MSTRKSNILKLISYGITFAAAFTTVMLSFGSVKTDIAVQGSKLQENAIHLILIDQEQIEQDNRKREQDKVISGLNSKLDTAVVILERIDRKVGRP